MNTGILRQAPVSVLAVVFLAAGAASLPARQEKACGNCPKPTVVIYDLDTTSLRPADTSADNPDARNYLQMAIESESVESYLITQDPQGSCVSCLGVHYSPDLKRGMTVDIFHPILPPTSGEAGRDYILGGSITGTPGSYALQLRLEDGVTRELVADSTATFAKADDAMTAAGRAAKSLGPVADAIRRFQKRKRDTSADTAIAAHAAITPSKQTLDFNEAVHIKAKVFDCDDVPLKGRTVKAAITGAVKYGPKDLVTDASGFVEFDATAGTKPGPAMIKLDWTYQDVTHKTAILMGGRQRIQVKDAPAGTWVLTFTAKKMVTSHWADSGKMDQFNGGWSYDAYSEQMDELANVMVEAWYRVPASAQVDGLELGTPPLAAIVDGTRELHIRNWKLHQDPQKQYSSLVIQSEGGVPETDSLVNEQDGLRVVLTKARGLELMFGFRMVGDKSLFQSGFDSRTGSVSSGMDMPWFANFMFHPQLGIGMGDTGGVIAVAPESWQSLVFPIALEKKAANEGNGVQSVMTSAKITINGTLRKVK